jgi:pimeloyl-ACP methyl ester carboxylesterase
VNAATTTDPSGQFVEINGVRLYVVEQGTGDPVLLLHGGLSSTRSWRNVIPRLQSAMRVVALDARGHGQSTHAGTPLTYAQLTDDVAALIGALGLGRPIVVGWSDGGEQALRLALRYPKLVRALVVCGTDYGVTPASQAWVRDFFGIDAQGNVDFARVDASLGAALPGFRAMHPNGDEQWRWVVEQTARLWATDPGLTDADYRRIPIPTLVMVGDRDDDVPLENALRMYRTIPDAELAVLPGADHSAPINRPELVTSLVIDFIERRLDIDALPVRPA